MVERFLGPCLDPLGLAIVDHRADEGVLVLGIARDEGLGFLHQHVAKLVVHILVNEDALDRDA